MRARTLLMRSCVAPLRSQSGVTLGVVMIFSIVMLITTLAVIEMGSQDAVLAVRDVGASQAFYLAESGLERGQSWLQALGPPPEGHAVMDPLDETPETMAGGSYYYTITPDSANGGEAPPVFTIRATGTHGNRTRTLERDVQSISFAEFLYLTDFEHTQGGGTPSWFTSADYIDGPLHTNDQVHILRDPVFEGYVRSAWGGPDDPNDTHVPSFEYWNNDPHNHIESGAPSNPPHDYPTFSDGYELGSTAIGLPADALDEFKAAAKDAGLYVNGGQEVMFGRPDESGDPMYGYVSYRVSSKKPWTDVEIASLNGIMYVQGQVDILGGVVDGEITLASNVAMTIADDIVYRGSDENGPLDGCDDLLGLLCMGDITVLDNEPNQNDIVLHGHIIATSTSFKVEHWSSGSPRGYIRLHGGICQKFRGVVGTAYLDGDELIILTGYAKDYHYDTRLRTNSPPGYDSFLYTGKYKRLAWRQIEAG